MLEGLRPSKTLYNVFGADAPLRHPIKLGSLSKGEKYLWKRGYTL